MLRIDLMPHKHRHFVEGLSVHVIHRGHNHMNVFGDASDYEMFLVMLAVISKQRGVAVHGYSLMTTHIHFLATPATKTSLPDTMKVFGGQYVKYFNRKYNRAGTLWRHRHRAILIEDERRWLTCLRYIERNPVAAKMVADPADYRWSSYRTHALGEPCEWLAPHPLYIALGPCETTRQAAYRALCTAPLTTSDLVAEQLDVATVSSFAGV